MTRFNCGRTNLNIYWHVVNTTWKSYREPCIHSGWRLLKVWLPGNRFSDFAVIPTSLKKCFTLIYILTFGIPSKNCLILSISSMLSECKVCNNKLTPERNIKDNTLHLALIHIALVLGLPCLHVLVAQGRTGQMMNWNWGYQHALNTFLRYAFALSDNRCLVFSNNPGCHKV